MYGSTLNDIVSTFLFFTETDDTWWYVMIRDDTADLRSYDEGSIRWQSEMTSCHGVALFTEKVYDVTIRRREVPSFHLSHRESWVLSHQRSKMFEHVNIVVTAGVVTQNSSEWRLVPQSFLARPWAEITSEFFPASCYSSSVRLSVNVFDFIS